VSPPPLGGRAWAAAGAASSLSARPAAVSLRRRTLLVAGAGLLAPGGVLAQERFSLFVGSPQHTVERMVRLARLREGDVVVDLGAGDGRVVLAALREHPGVRGWGVDINPELVREATANAARLGLSERAQFHHRNVFDADLSQVTVINMWLFPELMRLLRPKLLAEARPGTRIVSNGFDMGSWQPDETDTEGSRVLLWIVPARIEGGWAWDLPLGGATQRFEALVEQRFQVVDGIVRVGHRRGLLEQPRLRGEEIAFTLEMTLAPGGLVRQSYSGRVQGSRIEGSVEVTLRDADDRRLVLPWRAARIPTTDLFRPTGLETK